jgi:hypothetical protein
MTVEEALKIAREKEGYEQCHNPEHGFGKDCTYEGKTAPAMFVICPIVQLYPKPSFLFHSEADFLASSESVFRKRGWL